MEKIKKYTGKLLELSLLSALFIVPLSFWLPLNESFELPKSVNFYCFIALALCLWLGKSALEGALVLRFTGFSIPAAGIVLVSFFSMLKGAAINPAAFPMHWQFFKLILASAVFYILLINVFSRDKLFKLVFFIFISHLIVVLYGLLQSAGIDFIKWVSFGKGRVYSTLGNPDYMAAQFTLIIPAVIMLILSPINRLMKFFLGVFLTGMLFLIVVSHGRGAWLGFLVSLLFLIIMSGSVYGREFFRKYRLFFGAIAAFLVFLAIFFSGPLKERVKQGLSFTSDSVAVRLFYWESAVQMAYHNPLLGAGIGGFSLNTAFYQRKVYDRWQKSHPDMAAKVEPHVELYTHNDYLQTLAENGFIGLGVFIWLFTAFLGLVHFRALREQDTLVKNALLALEAGVIAFLVNALLNFPWRVMPTLVLLWSIFAMFSLLEQKKSFRIALPVSGFALPVLLAAAAFFSSLQLTSMLANACIKQGQAVFSQGRYLDARDIFDRGLKSNTRGTDMIELMLYGGNAYNALGDVNKAIEYYNRGLKMFPHFIESHYNVANVYMNNKMYDKAMEEYNKVLALNPKFAAAYNNMANIYFNDNKLAEARDMYLKALAVKPASVEARYNLGATLFRMGKYSEAYKELNEVLKYDPNYTLAKDWIDKMRKAGLVK